MILSVEEEEEGKYLVNSEINVSYSLYLNRDAYIPLVASVSYALACGLALGN